MTAQIFLGILGFASGLVVAGGVIALMTGLGVVVRYAGITHTAAHVRLYEDAILLGSIFGNWLTVYQPVLLAGTVCLTVLGILFGIFVGGWIMALAEIVNIFPIMARRIGLVKGMSLVVLAMAAGKTLGSLWHFYMRW